MKKKTRTPRSLRIFAALAIALLALSPAFADPSEVAPTTGFGEIVDVNVANVEVVVLDANGDPVQGLTAADFRLYEGEQPVDISNFYEVRGGRNLSYGDAAAEGEGSDVGSGVAEAAPAIDLDSRSFVLFFDNTSLEKKNRKRVLDASRDFVRDTMGAKDFVKVAALAPGGTLITLQNFTSDPRQVLAAVDAVDSLQAAGNMNESTFEQLVRDIVQAPVGSGTDGRVEYQARFLEGRIQAFARQAEQRSKQNLAAIDYLVRPIAGIPGQKAVVYFGQGLAIRPAESLYEAYANKFGGLTGGDNNFLDVFPAQIEALEYDVIREFEALVRSAQQSDIRFYALDASGRRANLRAQAAFGLAESRSYFAGNGEVWNAALQRQHELNLRQGLSLVATETGAALLADTRDYDGFLGRVDRDMNNFYSLGFQPERERDGAFHPLRVETANESYTLHYRTGYQNKTKDQQLVDLALATLLVPAGVDGLGLALTSGAPQQAERGRWELPLEIRFPAQNAALVEQPGGTSRAARLSALVVIQDEQGNLSPVREIPLEVSLRDGEIEQGKVPVAVADLRLLTTSGKQQIAVVVRDLATGATSAASVAVDASI
ncbi:MAG: VWA domain-containing protein [Acidobacteriota bacterium]